MCPVKNEEIHIRSFLENVTQWADVVIIANHNSTDMSLDIARTFSQVIVFDYVEQNFSNKIRWYLLAEVRKLFGSGNLIFFIDADEILHPAAIKAVEKQLLISTNLDCSFSFPWIHLWKNPNQVRTDGEWLNYTKIIAFNDIFGRTFESIEVPNDHTNRIPENFEYNFHVNYPLFHFQYLDLNVNLQKQFRYITEETKLGAPLLNTLVKYSHALPPHLASTKSLVLPSDIKINPYFSVSSTTRGNISFHKSLHDITIDIIDKKRNWATQLSFLKIYSYFIFIGLYKLVYKKYFYVK